MSYLGTPRLIFSGQFQADPSTVNNDPEHFDVSRFRSDYQLPGPGATNGWWNPRGTGAWRFRDCTVRRVVYRDGTDCDNPALDPLVGAALNPSDTRVEGKLVDLDPEQQMVSQIWGFRILLEGPGQTRIVTEFETSAFADIWVRYPDGQPDSFFSAFYQGLLEILDWQAVSPSRWLKELAPNGGPEQLSIKFVVDGFNDDSTTPEFTFGRVVGSIGLHAAGEPHHFVAKRCLSPLPQSPLNTAYAQFDGDLLALDLGNSLPTRSAGGPTADLDRLYVGLLPSNAAPIVLAEIPYSVPDWYESTAGIAMIRFAAEQLRQAANTPLAILQFGATGTFSPVLSEDPSGIFVRADEFVFRLNPGDHTTTTLHATRFGTPEPNLLISLGYDPSSIQGQIAQGPVPGPSKVGFPQCAFRFPPQVTTGADGTIVLELEAEDPGNPREYIDGQVYGVTYAPGSTPPPINSIQNPSQTLNALVWSGFQVPPRPTWLRDVQPVFAQYADLYPVMKPIVDLGNYASVISRLPIMRTVFSAPATDPNYMPVTRDLSEAKRTMIRNWLKLPLYMDLCSIEDLKIALQTAIELEHATIPPYLCALYSIKPGANTEVARLIRSVVMEEMLHMAQACNLLISIGGSPRIGHSKFVPNYPGPLPGGLRGSLTIQLRKCSIEQIRDVFLPIELPEETVDPVNENIQPGDPLDCNRFTIGWFYDEILRSAEKLARAAALKFGNTERQVSSWHGPGKLHVIDRLEDVRAAIHEIKHQGEGCTPLDPDDGPRELAHYYKFAEVVAGKRLVPLSPTAPESVEETLAGKRSVTTPPGYEYKGEPISFDPGGVYPMMDNPNLAKLPRGSRASILAMQFATTYQTMLNGLHRTFNGEPSFLDQAIATMYSLSLAARQLMETPSGLNDGTTAGPSFQLPFPL